MQNNLALECKNLTYGTPLGKILAKNISFELNLGEMLLITGPNGSGKSTLLQFLLGKTPPMEGIVRWNLEKKTLGYLPQLQDSQIHLPLTIADILDSSLQIKFITDKIFSLRLLEEKHLPLNWNHASGGEKKRTLLTRILLDNPNILILDEPFNHLDQESRQVMAEAVFEYIRRNSAVAIIVSHEDYWQKINTTSVKIKKIAL